MGVTEPREPAADRSRILPATAEEPAIDKDGSGIGGIGGGGSGGSGGVGRRRYYNDNNLCSEPIWVLVSTATGPCQNLAMRGLNINESTERHIEPI